MMVYFEDKRDAVQFVEDLLKAFPSASASITTTERGKYAVFFATDATASSSVDIEKDLMEYNFSSTQVNT